MLYFPKFNTPTGNFMEFVAKENHVVVMQLVAPDSFMLWLDGKTNDIVPGIIDPYRDKVLHEHEQTKILSMIEHLDKCIYNKYLDTHIKVRKISLDSPYSESILGELISKNLQCDLNWSFLREFKALLELSIESEFTIFCIGD
jgi:hypothetical protein